MDYSFSVFASADAWISLLTLSFLEIVLGVDNIIFISILVSKLPKAKQEMARRIGLFMAMFLRIALLLLLSTLAVLSGLRQIESVFDAYRVTPTYFVVTAGTVNDLVATQRRRVDRLR